VREGEGMKGEREGREGEVMGGDGREGTQQQL